MSALARDPIGLFVPWATVEEKRLRQRLHNARTLASLKAVGSQSDHARQLYWLVNEVSGAWLFAPAPPAVLKEIADTLVRVFLAAGAFEQIEGERA